MSSQVDSRSQSAGKRARTDGGRREDDWVCPSCKNVNFAFRTTCNMRNCNQSRPAERAKPMQTPPHYAASGGYMGPGTPPSMYLGGGAPPYGSPLFNGPAMHRYGIPQFPGGSAYPYGYGGRMPMGSPYGPMHMTGPPPYTGGSMMGAGGMYGMPMDRYGLAIPAGPGAMGTRAGSYSDEGSQKKPAGAGRDNDWECPNCHNINFAFRTVCNMRKCNTPRPENQGSKPDGSRGSKPKMPEGSWKCEQCNNINYPFRTKCNRPHCGAEKPSQTNNANDSGTDQDNQFLSCNITKLLSKLQLPHEFQVNNEQTQMDLSSHAARVPTSSRSLRMAALTCRCREWRRLRAAAGRRARGRRLVPDVAAKAQLRRRRRPRSWASSAPDAGNGDDGRRSSACRARGERLWIGTFGTPEEAAHAYDAAIFCFYGAHIPRIRKINFPTAPRPDIPEHVRVGLTVANIRAIAEMYGHSLADYIPLPPELPAAAPEVVVEAAPAPAFGASVGVGPAPTTDSGNMSDVGEDFTTIADCLLSFNPDEFDEIMDFASTD